GAAGGRAGPARLDGALGVPDRRGLPGGCRSDAALGRDRRGVGSDSHGAAGNAADRGRAAVSGARLLQGEQRDMKRTVQQSAHPWHGVDAEHTDEWVTAYIEIVPSDGVKYELDKETGLLRVDRPQTFSSMCPSLYGFIPQTYCGKTVAKRTMERTGFENIQGDADPIDICVISEKGFPHGNFLVRARPIGGFRMIDGDEADDKIIAVLQGDLAYGKIQDLA